MKRSLEIKREIIPLEEKLKELSEEKDKEEYQKVKDEIEKLKKELVEEEKAEDAEIEDYIKKLNGDKGVDNIDNPTRDFTDPGIDKTDTEKERSILNIGHQDDKDEVIANDIINKEDYQNGSRDDKDEEIAKSDGMFCAITNKDEEIAKLKEKLKLQTNKTEVESYIRQNGYPIEVLELFNFSSKASIDKTKGILDKIFKIPKSKKEIKDSIGFQYFREQLNYNNESCYLILDQEEDVFIINKIIDYLDLHENVKKEIFKSIKVLDPNSKEKGKNFTDVLRDAFNTVDYTKTKYEDEVKVNKLNGILFE